MRGASAILVTVLMGAALIAPRRAEGAQVSFPSCCQRHVKHHCINNKKTTPTAERNGQRQLPTFARMYGKWPRIPHRLGRRSHGQLGLRTSQAVFAELVSHPAVSSQTQSNYRVSVARAHQKRGPPTIALS